MKKSLLILMVVSAALYALRVLNSDMIQKGYSKWYLVRHTIVGAVGSGIFVWWSYEILMFHGLPESLCLATAGAMGYVGADVLARLVEKFLEKIINKF